MSLRVRQPIRTRIEQASDAKGRSLVAEAEHRLEWYDEHERQMGGPRTLPLLQVLTGISRSMYAHEDLWLDDRERYLEVVAAWHEALVTLAPAPKITIEEQIAAGRRLVAELLSTADVRRREHLRHLLGTMSKNAEFGAEVCAEFAAAAAFEPTQVEDRPPTPPVPSDWSATPRVHFDSAWQMARAALLGSTPGEPDDLAIAAYLIDDVEFRLHGGVPQSLTTAEELVRYRAGLLGQPSLEAAPPAAEPQQHALWRGLQLIAGLDGEKFPRRTKALRDLLRLLARDPALSDEIRREFVTAAGEPGSQPRLKK